MNVLSDERVVNNLIVDTYRKDMDAMPATLRSILEPLHLLNVPKTMAENIDLFIENSKVDSAWFDNKKVPALKRMTYRQANGDFLVSNICANSGVVVVAKPIQKNLFHKPVADLCLTTMHRLGIEVRLLHKQMFNMYATNCEKQFEIVKTSIFTYQLPLQNKMHIEAMEGLESDEIAKNIKDFHFKPIGWMPFYTNAPTYYPQVAIQKHGIKQSWSCDADLEWMREATDQFFDCWIAAYAKKHKRKINKTMQITLNKKGMTIGYELDDEQYDNEMLLSMTGATGKAKLVVRSTDFAFVMRQLADLNVRGAISMTANAHGIELTFATATHSYTCVIPSCDEKGERSPELFTEYMPIQMKEQFEYDFEKLDGGFTEADVLKVAAEVLA